MRHTHTFSGLIHSLRIHIRTKNSCSSGRIFIGLQSFKNFLSVVKSSSSRAQRNILKRNNFSSLPGSIVVIADKHMVCEYLTKWNIVEIYFIYPGALCFLNLNFVCHKLSVDGGKNTTNY